MVSYITLILLMLRLRIRVLRQLYFKEWREEQENGVPDDAFDDYWRELSPYKKKVRADLASRSVLPHTLHCWSEI